MQEPERYFQWHVRFALESPDGQPDSRHGPRPGAELFLMPPNSDPWGLNQMASLQSGTAPIVRATGGLADRVREYAPATGRAQASAFGLTIPTSSRKPSIALSPYGPTAN